MGRASAEQLPEHLRRDSGGAFILDFRMDLPDGSRKRVIKSLGKIPRALALKIRDKMMVDQVEGRYLRPKGSFRQAAESFLEYSRSRKRRHCAVTNLRKAGVAQNVIMSISGHKTASMFHRYDKVDREDRRTALERVRGLYASAPVGVDVERTVGAG